MRQLSAILSLLLLLLLSSVAFAQSAPPRTREVAPTPTAPAVEAEQLRSACEATCVAGEMTLESVEGGQCRCALSAPAETPAEVQERGGAGTAAACTLEGCNAACAPNLCVAYRNNSTGGCNYACILQPTRW